MFIVCWVFCNVVFSDSLKKVKAGPIMQIASSFKRLSSLQGLPHRSPKAMTILFFSTTVLCSNDTTTLENIHKQSQEMKKTGKGKEKRKVRKVRKIKILA